MKSSFLFVPLAALFCASSLSAQLFWNPAIDNYATAGGNGTWARTGPGWWDGTSNVNMADNANVILEGQGIITATNLPRPTNMTFQNLTGAYSLSGEVVFSTFTHAGAHTVGLDALVARAGASRTVNLDGTGILQVDGTVRRQLGGSATGLTFAGAGNAVINSTGGFMDGTLTMNGSGRLTWNGVLGSALGVTDSTGFQSVVLNSGEFFANALGNTSLTWNGGRLVYNLSNIDNSSNTITLGGAFNKGSGPLFEIDFQNTGIQETYTLVIFSGTDFALSDFVALNSPQPGTFSFGTTTLNDVELTTLLYTIPEPRVYAALFGLLALGIVAWRRRR